MPKNPRIETNIASAGKWTAYARRKGAAVRKGTRYEVQGGLLMQHSNRRGKRRSRLLDLPHEIAFLGVSNWPDPNFRFRYPLYSKLAATRDGFTTGAGLKNPTEEELVELTLEKPLTTVVSGIGAPTFLPIAGRISMATLPHRGAFCGLMADPSMQPENLFEVPNSERFGIRALYTVHDRRDLAFQFGEAALSQWVGVSHLVTRNITEPPGGNFQSEYLDPNIPIPHSDYVENRLSVVFTAVDSTGGDTDYGVISPIFIQMFPDPLFPDEWLVDPVKYTFPDIPQFEQPEWEPGSVNSGHTPSYANMAVANTDDSGGAVIYGYFYSMISAPEGRTCVSTIFRLRVDPNRVGYWGLIRCTTSGSLLTDRDFNPPADGRRFMYDLPSAFYSEGVSWGVFFGLDSTGFPTFGPIGNQVTTYNTTPVIVRDTSVVFDALPAGYTVLNLEEASSSAVKIGGAPAGTRLAYPNIFACHLLDKGEFGVTFSVYNENEDRRELAYWDSINGFGIWDLDLTEFNDRTIRSVYVPVTCYRRMTLNDDGELQGSPGFIIAAGEEPHATFVVTDGEVTHVAPVYSLAAMPAGNALSSNESTADAYDFAPEPEED